MANKRKKKGKQDSTPAMLSASEITDEEFMRRRFSRSAKVVACLVSQPNLYGCRIAYDRMTCEWYYGRGSSPQTLQRIPDIKSSEMLDQILATMQIPTEATS